MDMTFSGEFSSGRLVVGLDLFQPNWFNSSILMTPVLSHETLFVCLFVFVREILTVYIQETQTDSALEEELDC